MIFVLDVESTCWDKDYAEYRYDKRRKNYKINKKEPIIF